MARFVVTLIASLVAAVAGAEPIVISAAELAEEYRPGNRWEANQKYKRHDLVVSGHFSKASDGTLYFQEEIYCRMTSPSTMDSLERGDPIVIGGVGDGHFLGMPWVRDCYLIEPAPSRDGAVAASEDSKTAVADVEEPGVQSGNSPTCGPVAGDTRKDLQNIMSFCETAIPVGLVEGIYAKESILWVKVPYEIATHMLSERLQTEQLTIAWMSGWKQLSESLAVTVFIEWQDVQIAKGETTLFGGDQVTLKED